MKKATKRVIRAREVKAWATVRENIDKITHVFQVGVTRRQADDVRAENERLARVRITEVTR